jgi:hypothetical protein
MIRGSSERKVVLGVGRDPTKASRHAEHRRAYGSHRRRRRPYRHGGRVEGNRIKLTRKDSGQGIHKGHHHFIDKGLVADVEGNKLRLSAKASGAVMMEEEK